MACALVFLASGFEEIEAVTIVDVLRRCNVEVTVAGLTSDVFDGAHGIKLVPDTTIDKVKAADFEAVICPGGDPGYGNLRKNSAVLAMLKEAFSCGKVVAAICAGPAVLADAGILKGKNCTIYPGMEDELKKGGGKPRKNLVVEDGKIITSQGPATALLFALKVAERLVDKNVVEHVKQRTLANLALK